jgi:hypothetical protein
MSWSWAISDDAVRTYASVLGLAGVLVIAWALWWDR